MGFCGKYCSRGKENYDFIGAAEELAQDEFLYRSPKTDLKAINGLHSYLVNYHKGSQKWGPDINSHWLYSVSRPDPGKPS